MPEHRARKHHQDRVAEALREEIGTMIEGELSDPRIDFCYVTEVVLNPGGRSARVYVAVDGSVKDIDKSEQNTIAGLEAAKGFCDVARFKKHGWLRQQAPLLPQPCRAALIAASRVSGGRPAGSGRSGQ